MQTEGDDLFSMLLAARDAETGEGMSDAQVQDEIMELFVAAYETIANALNWIWYLLASSLSDLGFDLCRPIILPRIGPQILPKMTAAMDVWWRRGGFLALPSAVRARHWGAQPKLSANIRLMFQAMVTRLHSPRTQSSPRSRNWRNPITDLMMPNTGSGVCLRRP